MSDAPRFPLPAVLVGALCVLALGLPRIDAPALLSDTELLAGTSTVDGWLPGAALLRAELATFGSLGEDLSPTPHRLLALLLQVSALVLVGLLLRPRPRWATAGVLGLALYWVHPVRLDTWLFLGQRPILTSELLLVVGWACASRGTAMRWLGGALAAAGAFGLPAAAAFALLGATGRGRFGPAAIGSLLGAAIPWWSAPAAAYVQGASPEGVWRALLLPGDAAPALAGSDAFWGTWATVATVLALAAVWVAREGRRRRLTAAVVALVASAAAPWLPAVRPDRELWGATFTPDLVLIPCAAAVVMAVAACASRDRGGWLMAAALLAMLIPAFQRSRDAKDEETYVARALEAAPDAPGVRLLAAQRLLSQIDRTQPRSWYEPALEALRHVEFAQRTGGVTPSTRGVYALALAHLGKWDEARGEADALARDLPDARTPVLLRAEIEVLAGDRVAALRWLRGRAEDDVVRARSRALLDELYAGIEEAMRRGDAMRAQVWARDLVEVAPEERRAAELWAHAFRELGEFDQAVNAFTEVHRRFPQSVMALRALVWLYGQKEDAEQVQRYSTALLRLAGPDAFE